MVVGDDVVARLWAWWILGNLERRRVRVEIEV